MEKECKERGYWVSITIFTIDTQNKLQNGDIVDIRNF